MIAIKNGHELDAMRQACNQTGMTGEQRQAILSVVYAKKYPEIRDAALKIDKNAFIIADRKSVV